MRKNDTMQITEGVIWKQLLRFFFPILLGSFFQQMYNMADTVIVGRAIGTQALAAVGSCTSLVYLINGFFIGVSSGATVILSQHFGAGNRQGSERALHTGFSLSLILGVLTTAFGVFAGPRILRLIRTPESCIADAVLYAQIYFSGAIASMIYNMGTGILRAMGDSVRPTVFLVISCILNILLDILFVVAWGMGVAGAAAATVLAQSISALLVTVCLCRLSPELRLDIKKMLPHGATLVRILAIGIPAGLQMMTYDLSNIITQSSINSFGDVTAAAWAAYAKTDTIIWMIIGAFGVAITTFVGQNYGAQKYHRIHRGTWVCMAMCAVSVLCLSCLEVTFREWLLKIYTTDSAVVQTGSFMLTIAVPFCVLFVPVEVLGGTMRGTGYSLVPTVITTAFACVFRVLWVFLIIGRWHDLWLLVICYPISWFLCAAVFLLVYFRGHWLRKLPDPGDDVALHNL